MSQLTREINRIVCICTGILRLTNPKTAQRKTLFCVLISVHHNVTVEGRHIYTFVYFSPGGEAEKQKSPSKLIQLKIKPPKKKGILIAS